MNSAYHTGRLQPLSIEHFNTSLLDNLTTAVVLIDSDIGLYHLNPSAEAMLDISKRQSHCIKVSELFRNPEELLHAIETAHQSDNTVIIRKVEFMMIHGNSLVVDFSITPLQELGQTWFLMEMQEINRSWSISRKETLLSNHETTVEMIRGLSHEIKNPLGGIRGAAQLLAAELPDPLLRDYTNVIIEETDRLVNLVDRLTGSYKKPNLSVMNIHEVVERVRNLVEAETRGTIKIIRDYDPSLPEIRGDLEQLIQAVLNVVRNAMQALTENSAVDEQPQITLRTRAISHGTIGPVMHRLIARIEIIDNGPGILEDIAENIFYPLISGRAEGTGLGLSIAQDILKNHKGIIECESKPGKTSFIISFPLNCEHEGDYA